VLVKRKIAAGIIGALTLAAVLGGCGGGGSTDPSTTNPQTGTSTTSTGSPGATSTTGSTPTAEYLAIVAPVDSTRAAFLAGRTDATLRAAAQPFAVALTTWSGELSSYGNWPTSAKTAVANVVADVPTYVTGLEAFSSDTITLSEFKLNYGLAGDKLATASEALRSALGLPPAS
jgi:hypothetical protein